MNHQERLAALKKIQKTNQVICVHVGIKHGPTGGYLVKPKQVDGEPVLSLFLKKNLGAQQLNGWQEVKAEAKPKDVKKASK